MLQRGHPAWNKGIKIDRKTHPKMGHFQKHNRGAKLKMSLVHKGKMLGNTNGFKKGHIPWNKGKKFPKTKEWARKALAPRKMSSLEIKVANVIKKYSLPYKFVGNGKFFIERKNPDFVNTNGEKIAVEVYYRKHKEQVRGINIEEWKRNRKKICAKYGWAMVFIEEWQTNEENLVRLLK